MPQLFRNNAFSNLGASLTNSATTLTVATGHGDRFPVVAPPDFCLLTLQDASNNIEIVKVTARTAGSDSMTIVRAQEGTTARTWSLGDVVELRLTAGGLAGASVATATKLQTARTLTIGNTGKSFDGSANVSWSLNEIGVVSASDTTQGIVELATAAEAQAGTDNTRAVTPAGAMALVNRFGLGGSSLIWVSPNDYPLGSFNAAELTESEAVSLGFPALGGSPSTPRHWEAITFGVGNRKTQIASEVFGVGTTSARTFVRVYHDTTWYPWVEIYHSGNLNGSLGSTGYQRLPGGLIIQWGVTTGASDYPVTFPVAFPNTCVAVAGGHKAYSLSSGLVVFGVMDLTATGFLASVRDQNGLHFTSGGTTWIAIGY